MKKETKEAMGDRILEAYYPWGAIAANVGVGCLAAESVRRGDVGFEMGILKGVLASMTLNLGVYVASGMVPEAVETAEYEAKKRFDLEKIVSEIK